MGNFENAYQAAKYLLILASPYAYYFSGIPRHLVLSQDVGLSGHTSLALPK
jgi:hypothetical protein